MNSTIANNILDSFERLKKLKKDFEAEEKTLLSHIEPIIEEHLKEGLFEEAKDIVMKFMSDSDVTKQKAILFHKILEKQKLNNNSKQK